MPAIPLIGPSYQLRSKKAESRRLVGWIPVLIESQTGKGGAVAYLKQQPGLVRLVDLFATPPGPP